jgi:hypothetical protein
MMKFKLLNKITITAAAAGMFGAMLLSFGGVAQAACYQYNPNGFNTSSTPVFNNICGAPEGVGNESDFVRIRPDLDGNDEDNSTNNPAYTVGGINAACNTGDKFDVWNYLHNDASSDDNDNGAGTAVAHNVQTHMTAPLGTTNNNFTFGDTVTASNAATVTDSASLNCGSTQVKLSIVPGSVHIYSIPYAAWENLPDSTINTPTKIGSTSAGASSMTSGTMWGCWTYRIIIVYQVQVTAVPPKVTTTPPTCNLLTLESEGQVAKVEGLDYTAGSSTVNGATIQFYNGTTLVSTDNLTLAQLQALGTTPATYTYAATGSYKVVGTVNTTLSGTATDVTAATCAATFTASTPPAVTPPTTTTPTPPTTLVNTGPGSVAGMFAGVTAISAVGYRWFLGRRVRV